MYCSSIIYNIDCNFVAVATAEKINRRKFSEHVEFLVLLESREISLQDSLFVKIFIIEIRLVFRSILLTLKNG
jgi:hypothetical protein